MLPSPNERTGKVKPAGTEGGGEEVVEEEDEQGGGRRGRWE